MPTLPSGPRTPTVVQLLQWVYRPIPFMEACAQRFGPWFTVRFPGLSVVFTSLPEAAKEVFAADPDKLYAGEGNIIFKPLLGTNSLLVLDGPSHRRARRLMMPPFHGSRMQSYGRTITDIVAAHMKSWPRGKTFRLHAAMQAITLDVILTTVFGFTEGPRLQELRRLLITLLDSTTSATQLFLGSYFLDAEGRPPWTRLQAFFGPLTPWGRFIRLREEIDRILFTEIAERRNATTSVRDDVLSLLVAARDQEGDALSDEELRDEMMTLLVAGHETSATTLSWVFHHLMAHPEARERLSSELRESFGEGPFKPEKASELPYLEAVIHETLRLNPVIPFVWRILKVPLRIAGQDLPAGVAIAPSIYLIHRLPSLWRDPGRFDPDRFLQAKPAPWEFLPFGGGGRRCLGMAFAMYEMKIIVSEVLRTVILRPISGYEPRIVRRGVAFAPAGGLPVTAEAS